MKTTDDVDHLTIFANHHDKHIAWFIDALREGVLLAVSSKLFLARKLILYFCISDINLYGNYHVFHMCTKYWFTKGAHQYSGRILLAVPVTFVIKAVG